MSLTLLAPAAVLTVGLFVMLTGILRHNTDRFRKGLYFGLGALVLSGFVLIIHLANVQVYGFKDFALMGTGGAMFLAVAGAISYHYIHRVLPDFFVNSSLVFTIACWMSMGIFLLPSNPSKADETHSGHFLESHEYKARKSASEAQFASQMPLAQMPQ